MERLTEKNDEHYIARQDRLNGKIVGNQMCLDKLGELEDAEEQGLLLRLPIAIGSEFWELNYACKESYIYPRIAHQLHHCVYVMEHLGKTAFLTREEAEQALEKMKGV